MLAPEARLDNLVPTDGGVGSQTRVDLLATEAVPPVVLGYSTDNVAAPPTEDQLIEAFGNRQVGFTAFVIDNAMAGTVWLVIKSQSNTWWYEQLTKAV
ncbi:hypothetical protein LCGC14_0743020 [marine sediment metagenome]|uniref:Uncharacterized protein n=1 Tax=marine sediment metagenome TaxID=412755 RepID=A0A0F9TD89_9ZZZZ